MLVVEVVYKNVFVEIDATVSGNIMTNTTITVISHLTIIFVLHTTFNQWQNLCLLIKEGEARAISQVH